MRNVRAHYIRPNHTARIPERFIILDAEAHRHKDSRGEVQSWALAVATFLTWSKTGTLVQTTSRFDTPAELWQAVSEFTRVGRRTVLYAHNLNYDLRITQALSILPQLQWTMRDMRLDGRGSWSKWNRDKASLILCDSASIFPVKLETLAPMFGMRKLPLPPSGQRDKLFARCERDVLILSHAVQAYVQWLRSGVCGNWQMTGASQAWSHWRHSHYTHKILVHDNADALAAERAAMHSGRCEAFRHGHQSKGPFYEYDWQNSYPRIARDCSLPTQFRGTVTTPNPQSMARFWNKYAVLAQLEVTTTEPIVPAQHDERTLWPVGTFTTTLWDPEIRLLQEHGATFRVHKAWLYKREPALKDWAEWILSSLHDRSDTIEPWQRLILKHWSRALIGRFGMRYKSWESFATAETGRVYMSQLYDSEHGSTKELLQIGTDIFISGEQKEINDGCPQITSYIMSEARARLWRVYRDVGQQNVLYMDTDSLIVTGNAHRHIQQQGNMGVYNGLRSKGRFSSVDIYGPRSIICEKRPAVSGMPKGAVKVARDTYEGETWRSGKESIRQREHDKVRVNVRTFTLRPNQNRRHFLSDGNTVPYQLPGYTPIVRDVNGSSKARTSGRNDYSTLLAQTKTTRNSNRPKRYRHSAGNTMRSMPP